MNCNNYRGICVTCLIIDICFKRKWQLFVADIDFSKAYDRVSFRVPRNKLMLSLKRHSYNFMIFLFCNNGNAKGYKSILQDWFLGLRPANERRRYKVTPSFIGWEQTWNQPCSVITIVTGVWQGSLSPYFFKINLILQFWLQTEQNLLKSSTYC